MATKTLKKKGTPKKLKKQVSIVVHCEDTRTDAAFKADVLKLLAKYKTMAVTSSFTDPATGKTYSSYDMDWDTWELKPDAMAYGELRNRVVVDNTKGSASSRPRGSGLPVKQNTIAESAALEKARKEGAKPLKRLKKTGTTPAPKTLTRKTANTPPAKQITLDEVDAAVSSTSAAKSEEMRRRLRRR